LIESDNRRFAFDKTFLLDVVDHRLIRNFSVSSHITIPRDIEILGSSCFLGCQLLSSISFESNSRQKRVESGAFCGCHISIVIPSTVVFITDDAHDNFFQLSLSDPDFCPMFDRWRRLRKSGITVDFQRILGFASYLPCFKDFVLDPSGFEGKAVIGRNKGMSTQIYLRRIDGALTVMKAIFLCRSIKQRQFETEMENLLNLRQSRISVRSGWKLAKWNHFRAKSGRQLRTFLRLRPFFSRSQLVALPLRPSVQSADHLSMPLVQRLFRG
jgi:hypothetical protein